MKFHFLLNNLSIINFEIIIFLEGILSNWQLHGHLVWLLHYLLREWYLCTLLGSGLWNTIVCLLLCLA